MCSSHRTFSMILDLLRRPMTKMKAIKFVQFSLSSLKLHSNLAKMTQRLGSRLLTIGYLNEGQRTRIISYAQQGGFFACHNLANSDGLSISRHVGNSWGTAVLSVSFAVGVRRRNVPVFIAYTGSRSWIPTKALLGWRKVLFVRCVWYRSCCSLAV